MRKKTNIQEMFEKVRAGKKLIVYGGGYKFPECIKKIRQYMKILCDDWKTPYYLDEKEIYPYVYEDIVDYIEFVIDNDAVKVKKGYFEFGGKKIKVYNQDYLLHVDLSEYLILITTKKYEEEIKRQIESKINVKDIEYYGFFSDLQYYEKKCRGSIVERIILPYMDMVRMDYYKKNNSCSETEEYRRLIKTIEEGKCVINFISIDITTVCNLRCKNCVDYIPYLKEHRHYPITEIMNSIDRFFGAVDLVYCVSLGSGEALFHPMIKDILRRLLSEEKIERIDLVTNGAAYPSDKELLDILRDSRIMLHMSNYSIPEKTNVSRKFYEEQGIDIRFMYNQNWREQSNIFADRCLNKEELEHIYLNCEQARICNHFVTDGKYYSCGKIRRILELSDFDSRHDYIELALYQPKELKEMIMKQQLEPYMEACSWCDWHEEAVNVKPGEQII